jgi:D-beta-D-heptose 7-phosphate kinase/D-beta-D-heptose 1-phosphate adenosyltransferase|tara:strand:+ start:10379 stop:10786 length:408 start_codon:yes stop_codon:yes gene_type:complete
MVQQTKKMKVIFTNGCFDILHRGHVELLNYCKQIGGKVVVAINSDASIKRLKGESRPFYSQEDRKFMLESCKYVDEVIVFGEDTPYRLINEIKPDIIVKGGDYKKQEVVGSDVAEVQLFQYIDGYSTSKIIGDYK